ncbi:MAG TPA: DUF433 domain-containing protein [Thermomicrobiales bacterium]
MVTHSKTFTHIVRRADILGGEPIVAGTRVSVRTIVQYAQIYNHDMKEMAGVYPSIARADIEEALAYYEANREEIDRFIAENEDDASEGEI